MFYAPSPPGTCLVPDWQEPNWIPPTKENQAARQLLQHTIMPELTHKIQHLEAADIFPCLTITAREIANRTCTATAKDIRILHHLTRPSIIRHWKNELLHHAGTAPMQPHAILAAEDALITLREIHQATGIFCKQYPRQKRKYTRRQPDPQPTLNL